MAQIRIRGAGLSALADCPEHYEGYLFDSGDPYYLGYAGGRISIPQGGSIEIFADERSAAARGTGFVFEEWLPQLSVNKQRHEDSLAQAINILDAWASQLPQQRCWEMKSLQSNIFMEITSDWMWRRSVSVSRSNIQDLPHLATNLVLNSRFQDLERAEP